MTSELLGITIGILLLFTLFFFFFKARKELEKEARTKQKVGR